MSVLLIGAGGLGCGAALALAAAGISPITVVDDDVVEDSNLHRQVLLSAAFTGQPKVLSLAASIAQRFPAVRVRPVLARFEQKSAAALLADCQVVLDGSDNLATKFFANDAAVLARRPLVHAAAVGTGGQLMTVPVGARPCFRCLFEELPAPDADAPSCALAGVLGPVPGVLGALGACEAVRLVRGETPAFAGQLIRYNSPLMAMDVIRFRANPLCRVCGDSPNIKSLEDSATSNLAEACVS